MVDHRCIVNAMVALLATGGSTNHLIHWVAVARAAGIRIDWTDFDELSSVVPLLTRIYPNGQADVNDFERAGGPQFVLRELMENGLMHPDTPCVGGDSLQACARISPAHSADLSVLRPATEPFQATGGLRLLEGNLGRAVIKTSSVPDDRHRIQAPARVFVSQQAMLDAFSNGELDRDVIVVVRFQGPRANGMPELHKLTPPLAVLQDKGYQVALITDGRMSGASGVVPAAIHLTPETLDNGPIARIQDGDEILLDAAQGILQVLVDQAQWSARAAATSPDDDIAGTGVGRELFAGFRARATGAEQGACTW